MDNNQELIDDVKNKANNVWKWRNPYLVGIISFIHPFGLLFTYKTPAVIAIIFWCMIAYHSRGNISIPFALIFSSICGLLGYKLARHKNAAIEFYKYGLRGTGNENPNKYVRTKNSEVRHIIKFWRKRKSISFELYCSLLLFINLELNKKFVENNFSNDSESALSIIDKDVLSNELIYVSLWIITCVNRSQPKFAKIEGRLEKMLALAVSGSAGEEYGNCHDVGKFVDNLIKRMNEYTSLTTKLSDALGCSSKIIEHIESSLASNVEINNIFKTHILILSVRNCRFIEHVNTNLKLTNKENSPKRNQEIINDLSDYLCV